MSQSPGISIGTTFPAEELRPELVRAAREEKLKVVDEMGVRELRPISECIEMTGKKPVICVDVSKGDDESAAVRHPENRPLAPSS